MPKISIIIPVYNVEKYLRQCLDSVLAQTLTDIEIICVNDGSTDESGRILDQYAEQDRRVKVLHRSNAGYGAAMNAGLDMAEGEYIGIVESDDRIRPEMYQTLYLTASEDDLDLVKSDAIFWIESADYFHRVHCSWLDHYYNRVLSDIDRNIFFDFFMNIWTGIYKKSFLSEHNIRFNESPGASYQDNGFWMQTLLYCQKAKWISQAFYLYRQDNPGASVKNKKQMLAMAKEYEFLLQTLRDRKDEYFMPYGYYYKLYRHRGTFMRIADELKRSFCDQIKKDYMLCKSFVKGNNYLDQWLHEAVIRPDEFCDEFMRKKQKTSKRLESAAGFIIYGAGQRGDIVFRGLYNEGYYDKFCCFAVSQNPPIETLAGRKVLSIQDACRQYPEALVIVAVVRGSSMYWQMVKKLEELEICDYMDGSDIEESFYIV